MQELISRIRDEGVRAGRSEGERLLAAAREEAQRIVAEAEQRAAEELVEAREQIRKDRKAAEDALRNAARDTQLQLRQAVLTEFERHVRRLMTDLTTDAEFLRALVLVIAGRAADEYLVDRELLVLVGKYLDGEVDDAVREREHRAVLSLSSEMLREGVTLVASDRLRGGARVRVVGEDLEIDLSEEALTSVVTTHLLPRFRSMLTGVEQDR